MIRFLIFFFTFLLSISSQFPSITENGNPVNMNLVNLRENVEIPADVFACSNPYYRPDSYNIWNFSQIAHAFYEYGIKPWNFPNPTDRTKHISDCVAALVIAAGECSASADTTKKGCTTQSGASGVWQTDFLRTAPNFPSAPVMNLCLSAFGAGYMAAPWLAAPNKACTLSVRGGNVGSFYTCYQAKKSVNDYGSYCADPNALNGKVYSNFIGPFCHKSGSSRWSPCSSCCTLFNGGGNYYQPNPFPQYYFDMAATQGGERFEEICRTVAISK